jgi:hypothetical protein
MARNHPKDGFVDRLQKFGFPPSCYPSYKASDFYLGGFSLPLNTPAFAGRTAALKSASALSVQLDTVAMLNSWLNLLKL